MIRLATLLLVAASAALAAPAPPPTEKEKIAKLWGKTVSPSDECQFKLTGAALTIRTHGPPVRGLILKEKATMPRVARTVTGDFELTVKVADATAPNRDPNHTDAWPRTRAGLYVSGGGHGLEWHLSQYYSKQNGVLVEDLTRMLWVDSWYPGGGSGRSMGAVEANRSTYLRVTRVGKTVSVSHSADGKEWSEPHTPRKAPEFPDEVTVGVFLDHSTHQIADATFDEFRVGKPAKK